MAQQQQQQRRWIGRRAVVAGLASLALVGGAGVAALASPAAVPTASRTDVVVSLTGAGRNLPSQGGKQVTVLNLALPKGSWVLQSSGDFVNFGAPDYTRCVLKVGSTTVGSVTGTVGGNSGVAKPGTVVPFSLTGAVSTSRTFTAVLACFHDASGIAPYVDAGATLYAHRTTSLAKYSEH